MAGPRTAAAAAIVATLFAAAASAADSTDVPMFSPEMIKGLIESLPAEDREEIAPETLEIMKNYRPPGAGADRVRKSISQLRARLRGRKGRGADAEDEQIDAASPAEALAVARHIREVAAAAMAPAYRAKLDTGATRAKTPGQVGEAAVGLALANRALGSLYLAATGLEKRADDPVALSNMGALLVIADAPHDGLRLLRRAGELAPGSPMILANIGNAYAALGNREAALEAFRRTVEADPDHPMANFALGNAALDGDDPRRALDHFRRSLRGGYWPGIAASMGIARDKLGLKLLDDPEEPLAGQVPKALEPDLQIPPLPSSPEHYGARQALRAYEADLEDVKADNRDIATRLQTRYQFIAQRMALSAVGGQPRAPKRVLAAEYHFDTAMLKLAHDIAGETKTFRDDVDAINAEIEELRRIVSQSSSNNNCRKVDGVARNAYDRYFTAYGAHADKVSGLLKSYFATTVYWQRMMPAVDEESTTWTALRGHMIRMAVTDGMHALAVRAGWLSSPPLCNPSKDSAGPTKPKIADFEQTECALPEVSIDAVVAELSLTCAVTKISVGAGAGAEVEYDWDTDYLTIGTWAGMNGKKFGPDDAVEVGGGKFGLYGTIAVSDFSYSEFGVRGSLAVGGQFADAIKVEGGKVDSKLFYSSGVKNGVETGLLAGGKLEVVGLGRKVYEKGATTRLVPPVR